MARYVARCQPTLTGVRPDKRRSRSSTTPSRCSASKVRNMSRLGRVSENLRVVAFLRSKPGEEENVRRALLECVSPGRAEDGNLLYVVHTDQDDPATFVVVEHWESSTARARHLQTEHFRRLGREVDEADRLEQHTFHVLEPLTY